MFGGVGYGSTHEYAQWDRSDSFQVTSIVEGADSVECCLHDIPLSGSGSELIPSFRSTLSFVLD